MLKTAVLAEKCVQPPHFPSTTCVNNICQQHTSFCINKLTERINEEQCVALHMV